MEVSNLRDFFNDKELVTVLKEKGQILAFKHGDVILKEQSIIKAIFVLIKGTIKVSCMSDGGEEMLMYYIRPGESCIMSFLGALHHLRSRIQAEVIEDAELLVVTPEESAGFLKHYPDWADYFFKLYDKRFEELLNIVKLITFENMEARILRFLIDRAQLNNSKVIYITHQKLATEVAAARVVVSRILKQMEDNKQVILGRGYIKLLLKSLP